MKDGMHMSSIHGEKNIIKFNILYDKNSQQTWYRGNISWNNKGHDDKLTVNLKLNGEKLKKAFPLTSEQDKDVHPFTAHLFNIVLEVIVTAMSNIWSWY